jgi:hypothetical protein
MTLHGWLNREFPDAVIEKQKGASRPDIVIGDIAIEVKGPTDIRSLKDLSDKCIRYSLYYNSLIFVLFEPSFPERHYQEFLTGLQNNFQNVEVIIK